MWQEAHGGGERTSGGVTGCCISGNATRWWTWPRFLFTSLSSSRAHYIIHGHISSFCQARLRTDQLCSIPQLFAEKKYKNIGCFADYIMKHLYCDGSRMYVYTLESTTRDSVTLSLTLMQTKWSTMQESKQFKYLFISCNRQSGALIMCDWFVVNIVINQLLIWKLL